MRPWCFAHEGDTIASPRYGVDTGLHEKEGERRVVQVLRNYQLDTVSARGRLRVFCGDLDRFRFGVADPEYDWLCRNIDMIYHCGAVVDWTSTYDDLCINNVRSVLEVLRLARSSFYQRIPPPAAACPT